MSHFDVSLVDRTSWTRGDILNGTRGSNGAPRRAAATVDNVNASQVIGDILVLKDITEDGDNASGTVTYKYNVKLDKDAIAVDEHSDFTLNWTASTSVVTSVNDIKASADVTGVTYYNLQGVASSEPFAGFNIVVTTLADGSQTAVKVVR